MKNTVAINAPVSRVWNALVDPEQTKKYMFGCETVSNWKKGSYLLWRGMYEGREMIFVKGTVVDFIPGKRLVYTTFDPNGTIEDIPENYLTVTYQLSTENNQTILTATQGDFSTVADGKKRYEEASEGWNSILVAIKNQVEAEEKVRVDG